MKVCSVVFAAALCAVAICAAEESGKASGTPKTGMRAKTGGTVMRPLPEGALAVVFLDATGGGEGSDALAAFVKRFASMTRLNVRLEKGDAVARGGAGGDVVVALVPDGDLAVMPARRMAVVPAGDDGEAVARDLWKATVAVFSLMGEAPNDFNGTALIRGAAESIGIPFVERVFYKKALEEGWAPEPADENQKRLWDEFHGK